MALKCAKEKGAKMIFYSSPEAFGEQESMPLTNQSNSILLLRFASASLIRCIKTHR